MQKINNNVSVIITTYNSSQYISNALESVCSQEGVNIEILIIDDCSPDYEELKNVVSNFPSQHPIKTFQPKEKGHANISRNIGIAKAMYEHIAFLDADDTWNPKHLITSINTISENSWDGCFSKVNLISKNTRAKSTSVFCGDICNFIFKENGISVTSSLVIKKEPLTDIAFNNHLKKHQDWDFIIRFSSKYKLGQSPYYGLNYTLSTGQNMSAKFNFSASILFMNSSLPKQWHAIFITNFINKVLLQKDYDELVNLHYELKSNYIFPFLTLGLRNVLIVLSAQNKVLFNLSSFCFHSTQNFKNLLKRLLKFN